MLTVPEENIKIAERTADAVLSDKPRIFNSLVELAKLNKEERLQLLDSFAWLREHVNTGEQAGVRKLLADYFAGAGAGAVGLRTLIKITEDMKDGREGAYSAAALKECIERECGTNGAPRLASTSQSQKPFHISGALDVVPVKINQYVINIPKARPRPKQEDEQAESVHVILKEDARAQAPEALKNDEFVVYLKGLNKEITAKAIQLYSEETARYPTEAGLFDRESQFREGMIKQGLLFTLLKGAVGTVSPNSEWGFSNSAGWEQLGKTANEFNKAHISFMRQTAALADYMEHGKMQPLELASRVEDWTRAYASVLVLVSQLKESIESTKPTNFDRALAALDAITMPLLALKGVQLARGGAILLTEAGAQLSFGEAMGVVGSAARTFGKETIKSFTLKMLATNAVFAAVDVGLRSYQTKKLNDAMGEFNRDPIASMTRLAEMLSSLRKGLKSAEILESEKVAVMQNLDLVEAHVKDAGIKLASHKKVDLEQILLDFTRVFAFQVALGAVIHERKAQAAERAQTRASNRKESPPPGKPAVSASEVEKPAASATAEKPGPAKMPRKRGVEMTPEQEAALRNPGILTAGESNQPIVHAPNIVSLVMRARRHACEDRAFVMKGQNGHTYLAVFDGLGGHAKGAEASNFVAEYMKSAILEGKDIPSALAGAARELSAIAKRKKDNRATTASIVDISPSGQAVIYSVGDSPLYTIGKGTAVQHTGGLNYLAEHLKLPPEERASHVFLLGRDADGRFIAKTLPERFMNPEWYDRKLAELINMAKLGDAEAQDALEIFRYERSLIASALGGNFNPNALQIGQKTLQLKPGTILVLASDGVGDPIGTLGLENLSRGRSLVDFASAVARLVEERRDISRGVKKWRMFGAKEGFIGKDDDATMLAYAHL